MQEKPLFFLGLGQNNWVKLLVINGIYLSNVFRQIDATGGEEVDDGGEGKAADQPSTSKQH